MADDWRELVGLAVEDALAGFPFAEIPKTMWDCQCLRCRCWTMVDLAREIIRCNACGLRSSRLEITRLVSQSLVAVSKEKLAQREREVIAMQLERRAVELREGADVRLVDRAAAGLYKEVKGSSDE